MKNEDTRIELLDIDSLVKKVIQDKEFLYDKNQFLFDYSDLLSNGILKEDNDKIIIEISLGFTKELYEQLASIFSFTLTQQFPDTIGFYKIVSAYFMQKNYSTQLSEQLTALLKHLIIISNTTLNVSFEDIPTIFADNENRVIYEFNAAFSKSLDQLNIRVDILLMILKFLHGRMDSDAIYNGNLADLVMGIRNYVAINPEKSRELLELCIADSTRVTNIEAAIIAGLYNNDKAEIANIQELLIDDTNAFSVLCAMKSFNIETNNEAETILKLVDKIKVDDLPVLVNLPQFYRTIITNTLITDPAIKKISFSKLEVLFANPNTRVKQIILQNVSYLKEYDDQVFVFVEMLNENKFDEALIHDVSSLLANLSTSKYFFKFIKQYALNYKNQLLIKPFEFPISRFAGIKREEFSRELIKMLIDDNGYVRHAAKSILRSISAIGRPYELSINLTEMSAVEQYKLWVSILSDDIDIKSSLPPVLPIRKSSHSFVVEALLFKIELEVDNYGQTILEILQMYLDASDEHDKQIMERIEKKIESRAEVIANKMKIKELNPYYTQSKLFRKFHELYSSKLSEGLNKEVAENSFFGQFFKTVVLAKGGGWKAENKSEITQLGVFENSIQFPRMYFISPDIFDYEVSIEYQKDWSEKFKEWEAIISS